MSSRKLQPFCLGLNVFQSTGTYPFDNELQINTFICSSGDAQLEIESYLA